MKIIQILHHSLSPYKVGGDPIYYEEDWHVKVGKRINLSTNKYDVECWRPEKSIYKPLYRIGKENIKFKIFPSKYLNKQFEISFPLISELIKEKKKGDVLFHIHGLYNFHTYTILTKLGQKVPIIAQSHGGFPALVQFKSSNNPLKFLFLLKHICESKSFKYIDQFLCLNRTEQRFLSNLYGKNKVKIQPMGVDFNKFKKIENKTAKSLLNLAKEKKYVLYVGRVEALKGIEYLIKAIKDLSNFYPNVKLLIIGRGTYENNLLKLINNLKVKKFVDFLGFISNDELPLWYNAADVVVFPSLSEAFPIVPIEALACERPFIGTDVGGVSEIIRTFEGGFLIPKKDSESIKRLIIEIFNKNQIIKINRNKGESIYSWNKIIKRTLELYDYLFEEYY